MSQAAGGQAGRELCHQLNTKQKKKKNAGVSLAENIAKFCKCQIAL